ncbi:hypothetical protein P3X46_025285 [Hevea brasiliensis]|uniref:PGG domain-containing protein n=1 Tax=Hevea brasiliensis TaxID=3981 RepID=A0ABQ9L6M7_HEVBR|nr:uncharacterized protein LOC110651760 [Hevea brasiliensis]KAJ9159816.1 hypothetical protein P3X46_025285 [Hevea brasiliensis]
MSSQGNDPNAAATRTGELTKFQSNAVDVLSSINSLFTVAVFLGLSFASPNQKSIDPRSECNPDATMLKRLVLWEVISFSFFLFSSLFLKSLQLYINMLGDEKKEGEKKEGGKKKGVVRGMFYISVLTTTLGVASFTVSMAYLIQIQVGKMSCWIFETTLSVIFLAVMVFLGIVSYLVVTALTFSLTTDDFDQHLSSTTVFTTAASI